VIRLSNAILFTLLTYPCALCSAAILLQNTAVGSQLATSFFLHRC